MSARTRRGVSLIELLVAMLVAALVGTALMQMMLSHSRFEERVEGDRSARRTARSAVSALLNDLRMVDPSWGVEALSGTSVTVKVPYALGLVCASSAFTQRFMLLPVDSVVFGTSPSFNGYSGYAVRQSSGAFAARPGGSPQPPGAYDCTTAGLGFTGIAAPTNQPNAGTRTFTVTFSGTGLVDVIGSPAVIYRRTRFYFGPSNQAGLAGRTALWRDYLDDNSAAIELAAPFDASAAFRFYVSDATTPTSSVPGVLSNLTGLQLVLPGESEATSRKQAGPEQADLTTAVFFVNRGP